MMKKNRSKSATNEALIMKKQRYMQNIKKSEASQQLVRNRFLKNSCTLFDITNVIIPFFSTRLRPNINYRQNTSHYQLSGNLRLAPLIDIISDMSRQDHIGNEIMSKQIFYPYIANDILLN
jgi:hypothetical protein